MEKLTNIITASVPFRWTAWRGRLCALYESHLWQSTCSA